MESWPSLVSSILRLVTPMQSAYSEAEMQRCQIQAQVAKAKEPMGRATRTLARTAESADRFSDTSLVIAFDNAVGDCH